MRYIIFLLLMSVPVYPVTSKSHKSKRKRVRLEQRVKRREPNSCFGLKQKDIVKLAQTGITAGVSVAGSIVALVIAIINAAND